MPSVWRRNCCGSNRALGRSPSSLRAAALLKSRSMGRRSIPNWPPANSPSRKLSSRPQGPNGERGEFAIFDLRFPISDRTSPIRRVTGAWWSPRSSKPLSARFTGRGMFDSYPLRQVHCRFSIFDFRFSIFDSRCRVPPNWRLAIGDWRLAMLTSVPGARRLVDYFPIENRKSKIENHQRRCGG